MAIYDFKCMICGKMENDYFLPMTHADDDRPVCCEQHMRYHITSAPFVHWKDYDLPDGGFKAVSVPNGPMITTKKQNEEFMKRHNLLDANEVFSPPTEAEEYMIRREMQDSIDAITPTAKQQAQLRDDGMIGPDGELI
jgi:hypothetical protein